MWFYEYLYLFTLYLALAPEMVVRDEKLLHLNWNWTVLCCLYVKMTGEELIKSWPTDTVAAHNSIIGGKWLKINLNLGYLERNAQCSKSN